MNLLHFIQSLFGGGNQQGQAPNMQAINAQDPNKVRTTLNGQNYNFAGDPLPRPGLHAQQHPGMMPDVGMQQAPHWQGIQTPIDNQSAIQGNFNNPQTTSFSPYMQ